MYEKEGEPGMEAIPAGFLLFERKVSARFLMHFLPP